MPIYEYACGKCRNEFEVEQRITEDPIKTCPKCRSRQAKRLISQTSFVLKGGGWYADAYSTSKPDATGESKESSAPESKDEKKKKKDKAKGKSKDSKAAA